jgi:hypothetical protein
MVPRSLWPKAVTAAKKIQATAIKHLLERIGNTP